MSRVESRVVSTVVRAFAACGRPGLRFAVYADLRLLILLACLHRIVPAAAGAEPLPAGPEDSLLAAARAEHWAGNEERAIPIFRDRLATHPDDHATRLDLANALAWSGNPEAALPLYDDLLAERPGDAALLRGRANALRWAGRSRDALAAVRDLRAHEPHDRELRAIERALAREIDPAASMAGELFVDSGDMNARSASVTARLGAGRSAAWTIRAGAERLAPRRGGNAREAGLLLVGSGIATGSRSELAIEAGAAAPREGDPLPRVRAGFRARPLARLSLQAAASYSDRGYELKSLIASDARLRGTDGSLAGYLSLSPEAGIYMRLRAGGWDDGNRFHSAEATLDASLSGPWRAALAGQWSDYARPSLFYYTPREEWTAAAWLFFAHDWPASISVEVAGWVGAVGNRDGSGNAGGGRVSCRAPIAKGWDAVATAEGSATRRISRYESRTVRLGLEWRP